MAGGRSSRRDGVHPALARAVQLPVGRNSTGQPAIHCQLLSSLVCNVDGQFYPTAGGRVVVIEKVRGDADFRFAGSGMCTNQEPYRLLVHLHPMIPYMGSAAPSRDSL